MIIRDEENLDATNELVTPVEENVQELRPIQVLMEVPYAELTEEEKEYLISGLKVRNQELDRITQQTFKEVQKIKQTQDADLAKIEDTLTFIKTEVGQCLGAVSLAIKNIEREVRK